VEKSWCPSSLACGDQVRIYVQVSTYQRFIYNDATEIPQYLTLYMSPNTLVQAGLLASQLAMDKILRATNLAASLSGARTANGHTKHTTSGPNKVARRFPPHRSRRRRVRNGCEEDKELAGTNDGA
jgi:hypothetical protein